jgi:hypothetical protein
MRRPTAVPSGAVSAMLCGDDLLPGAPGKESADLLPLVFGQTRKVAG